MNFIDDEQFFVEIANQFDEPSVAAIALTGSHARGEADGYSDVDLLRLLKPNAEVKRAPGSHLIHVRLVVVSDCSPQDVTGVFERPEIATVYVAGLRTACPLIDKEGEFHRLQERARNFRWTEQLQQRANAYASEQMAGWVEEVHKALGGLQRRDMGRLLSGLFGLTWGLTGVVRVQRGILLRGDNAICDQIDEEMGQDSDWVRLRRIAFGLATELSPAPTLEERTLAGLRLYILTARLLEDVLLAEHRAIVEHAVGLVDEALAGYE